jgi:hypothetical protein
VPLRCSCPVTSAKPDARGLVVAKVVIIRRWQVYAKDDAILAPAGESSSEQTFEAVAQERGSRLVPPVANEDTP